jgi:hypothetical protein
MGPVVHTTTTGWRPTCACRVSTDALRAEAGITSPDFPAEVVPSPIPALVLDPFAGSGTTVMVARALGRRGVGCDLSFDYLSQQARARLEMDALDDWHEGNGMQAAETADLGPLFAQSRGPEGEALAWPPATPLPALAWR